MKRFVVLEGYEKRAQDVVDECDTFEDAIKIALEHSTDTDEEVYVCERIKTIKLVPQVVDGDGK